MHHPVEDSVTGDPGREPENRLAPSQHLRSSSEVTYALRNVDTFDPAAFNEVRQTGAPPLGANGFAPPSLLSAFAFEQGQFHINAAASFDDALDNVTHRSAGTGGVDTLSNPADRDKVAKFLRSIDAASAPVP